MISPELLELLRCPACRGDLTHDPRNETLTCRACGRLYRVEEGIPIMIPDEEKKP